MGLGGMLCLQLRQVSYLICARGTKFVFVQNALRARWAKWHFELMPSYQSLNQLKSQEAAKKMPSELRKGL